MNIDPSFVAEVQGFLSIHSVLHSSLSSGKDTVLNFPHNNAVQNGSTDLELPVPHMLSLPLHHPTASPPHPTAQPLEIMEMFLKFYFLV